MKNKSLVIFLLVAGLICSLGAFNPALAYNEARVRYILVDISLGGPIHYYREFPENPNAREAVNRWEHGVRVLNLDQFERCDDGYGPGIVYAGTCDIIDGMDVDLTTDHEVYYRVPRVRIVMPEIHLFGSFPFHRRFHPNEGRRHEHHRNDNNNHNNNNWRPIEPPPVGADVPHQKPNPERP